MFEEEIKTQVKKLKRGATYREVKDDLKEEHTDTEALLIVTQAFKEYKRGKAKGLIFYAFALIVFTALYALFYGQLKPVRWIMASIIFVVALAQGLYLKYQYRKSK